jgi:hypothetical protein
MDPLFDITAYIVACGACINGGSTHKDLYEYEKKFRSRVNEICDSNGLNRTEFLQDFRKRFATTNDGFALLEEMALEYPS